VISAVSQAPEVGWAVPQTEALLSAGAVLLAAFFAIETRVEAPLLPLALLRLPTVAGSNAVGFLLGTSFLTFVFLGTLYMQQVLGLSPIAAGAAWTAASCTSLAFGGLSQRIVTATSPKAVMTFGMTLIGVAILWAARAPLHGSFWSDLAGPFVLGGIGTAFAFIPVSIGALSGIGEHHAGVASGMLNTSQNLGSAIGVAVASSVAASQLHLVGHHGVAGIAALAGGLRLALLVCGLSALVAAPTALLVDRSGPRRKGRRDASWCRRG